MWNEKTSRFLVSQKGALCENSYPIVSSRLFLRPVFCVACLLSPISPSALSLYPHMPLPRFPPAGIKKAPITSNRCHIKISWWNFSTCAAAVSPFRLFRWSLAASTPARSYCRPTRDSAYTVFPKNPMCPKIIHNQFLDKDHRDLCFQISSYFVPYPFHTPVIIHL